MIQEEYIFAVANRRFYHTGALDELKTDDGGTCTIGELEGAAVALLAYRETRLARATVFYPEDYDVLMNQIMIDNATRKLVRVGLLTNWGTDTYGLGPYSHMGGLMN